VSNSHIYFIYLRFISQTSQVVRFYSIRWWRRWWLWWWWWWL